MSSVWLIARKKLREVPIGTHFSGNPRKTRRQVRKARLEVVHSKESGHYFVVRGLDFYHQGVALGFEFFNCIIMDKVKRDSEAYVERMAHVLTPYRRFHLLEQALALQEFKALIIKRYGPDAFYWKGGDRRSPDFEKMKLWKLLKKRMPSRKYRIGVLLRFGEMVGPLGLEGLYRVARANHQKIRVRQIHLANSHLRKVNMREKIEETIKRMKSEGCPRDQVLDEIGLTILNELFAAEESKTGHENDLGGDEAGEEGDGEGDESDGETDDSGTPTLAPEGELVDQKHLQEIIDKGRTAHKRFRGIIGFLESKAAFTVADKNLMEPLLHQHQESYTDFSYAYYAVIDENYSGRGVECQFCPDRIKARRTRNE